MTYRDIEAFLKLECLGSEETVGQREARSDDSSDDWNQQDNMLIVYQNNFQQASIAAVDVIRCGQIV
jgi:hypothetical protein